MTKYNVEVTLVENLITSNGYGAGVATLVGEQLSTYLGRCEAAAVAARKDGRMVKVGKADKDANADVTFLPLKAAKRDVSYLPCRLLVIADAATAFAKSAGLDRNGISFELPESVQALLKGMEAAGSARKAESDAKAAEAKASAEAVAERQVLAAQLLAIHDAAEEQKKVKAAQAVKA